MATRSGIRWAFAIAASLAVDCGGGGGREERPDAATISDAALGDAPTGNATLAALTTTNGVFDPPFEPEVNEYDLDLLLAEPDVAFTPTAAAPDGITITVDGADVASGITSPTLALAPGSRDLHIVASAAGGASADYLIHVHRGVDVLASLTPSNGALAPSFNPDITSYGLGLPLATMTLAWTPALLTPGRAGITVGGAVVASGTSSIAAGLAIGDNPTTVVVTPQTRPARTYELGVVRGSDALVSIALSYAGGTVTNPLLPTFDPTTSSYNLDVGLRLQRLQISVTPYYANSTITVSGSAATAGTPTTPISLNLGLTAIPIVVTAPDGAQGAYTLNVTRASAVLQQAYGKASNTGTGDLFGFSVALWGDTLAVGAYQEASAATGIGGNQADNTAAASGAVYVFTRTGATWSQQAYLKASNTEAADKFGYSVALWGDTLAVGAQYEDSAATGVAGNQADNTATESGAVYVFARTGTTWSQQAYLKASNTGGSDNFGWSIALWGDTLAVSARNEASAATGVGGDQTNNSAGASGAVYVFVRTGATWSQQAYLKASNSAASDYFGWSVALSADTLAVGAQYEDSAATGVAGNQADNTATESGAVYVFTRTGTTWSQQAYLKASNTGGNDNFGWSIALWGDTLAVGAELEDSAATGVGGSQTDNSAADSGAVYVFTRTGITWSQQAYLKPSNTGGDTFGWSVALWGDSLAVGATGEDSAATGIAGNQADNSALSSGAVYVFTRSGTTWSQQAYVKASNTGSGDEFGVSVALWGDTLAVGAHHEDSAATGVGGDQGDTANASGAVYVFR